MQVMTEKGQKTNIGLIGLAVMGENFRNSLKIPLNVTNRRTNSPGRKLPKRIPNAMAIRIRGSKPICSFFIKLNLSFSIEIELCLQKYDFYSKFIRTNALDILFPFQ